MPAASIHIERDPSRGMARVSVNGRLVMEDLSQNFHPDAAATGISISPSVTPDIAETFADVLLRALASLPEERIVTRGIYMADIS